MFSRINLGIEKIICEKNTHYESKYTNNYLVNIEKVSKQSKRDWINF
jgi:hypothetical protein